MRNNLRFVQKRFCALCAKDTKTFCKKIFAPNLHKFCAKNMVISWKPWCSCHLTLWRSFRAPFLLRKFVLNRCKEGGEATSPSQLPNLILPIFGGSCPKRGLPNLPQTVFREGSSICNRQFLLKTELIWLFKHGSLSIVSLTVA